MPENCRHWQGLLAEHILSSHGRSMGIEPAMDHELAEHLAGCSECQATAAEFRAVADALAHTAPTADHIVTPASAGLTTRIAARLDLEQHSRRRRQRFVAVAAIAAAILAVVSVTVVRQRDTDEIPGERVALNGPGVQGDATLRAWSWGTHIDLAVSGCTPGERYSVWLERADGTRVGAGTFLGVRTAKITLSLSSALVSSEAVAIGISESEGDVLVRAPLN